MGNFMDSEDCTIRVNRTTISFSTKVIGNEHSLMVEARPFIKTETSMKEPSLTGFEEAMERMTSTALLGTRVSGKRTSFMGLVNSSEMGSSFLKGNFKTA